MVCPVNHILCGIHAPLLHPEEVGAVFIMACIHVHRTVVYHRSWVTGTPGLYERILRPRHQAGGAKKNCTRQSFHLLMFVYSGRIGSPISDASASLSSSLKSMNCGFSAVHGVQAPSFWPLGLPYFTKFVQAVSIFSDRSQSP